MRKIISLAIVSVFFLLLGGCSELFSVSDIPSPEKPQVHPFKVSVADVVSYIEKYKQGRTKGDTPFFFCISPIVTGGDTLMYLVNYEKGWEVLSSDTRFPKVLAFSKDGNAHVSDLFDNQSSSSFFNEMSRALRVARTDTTLLFKSEKSRANWSDIKQRTRDGEWWSEWSTYHSVLLQRDTIEVDHMLDTHWGQSGIWAVSMPYMNPSLSSHCYAGCTMVATAQVLYYLHYSIGAPLYTFGLSTCSAYLPTSNYSLVLNSSNTSFYFSSDIFWDQMAKNIDEASTKNYSAVSTLMLRLGYLVGANYKASGTSGSIPGMKTVLASSEFGIDCWRLTTISFDTIYHQIVELGRPCILSIWDSSNCDNGHAVVVDGYHRERNKYLKYQVRNNNYGEIQYRTIEEYDNTDYVAINWGYDGNGDYDISSGSTIWYIAMPSIYNNYIDWTYNSGVTTYHYIQSMLCNFHAI